MFDVLAYTDTDVDAPGTWVESDAKLISNPQMVKLHSFDTKVCNSSISDIHLSGVWYCWSSIGLLRARSWWMDDADS